MRTDQPTGEMLTTHPVEHSARLPVNLTSLVGRDRESATIAALLVERGVPILTLTGAGGSGKTRLAARVATEIGDRFANGVRFVDLAPLRDPDSVVSAIAHAFGIRDVGGSPLLQRLTFAIGEQHILLVLDNFEQITAGAPLLVTLLGACPRIRILVTSREALRVSGEQLFPVDPLPVPAEQASLDEASENDAVRLFCERARAALPDFRLTLENVDAVAAICRRLDGLPLAIELAAARMAIFSPAVLLERLERRLPILTDGARDVPPRQRSMRDAIAWSHDLLTQAERSLFRRLAVFVGGFTLDAAEIVSRSDQIEFWPWRAPYDDSERAVPIWSPSDELIGGIASLVGKCLLRRDDGPTGEARFSMLDTIREFGLEQLDASDEAAAVRRRHAMAYAALAERVGPDVEGSDPVLATARLSADDANLRSAFEWAVSTNEAELALRLVVSLHDYADMRSRFRIHAEWSDLALGLQGAASPELRLEAMFWGGVAHHHAGNYERAHELAETVLRGATEANSTVGTAMGLFLLSFVERNRDNRDEAVARAEEALELFRQGASMRWLASAMRRLAIEYMGRGDYAAAEALFQEALNLFERIGDAPAIAMGLYHLAGAARGRGDLIQASSLMRDAIVRETSLGRRWMIVQNLIGLAETALLRGHTARAVRVLSAAEALSERIGFSRYAGVRDAHDEVVDTARSALGESEFAFAWAEGRALSWQSAIDEGVALAEDRPTARASAVATLTKRERDVLALLDHDLSDRQIADRLFISVRTAEHHVARILAKLGVRTRAEAIGAARDAGHLPPTPRSRD